MSSATVYLGHTIRLLGEGIRWSRNLVVHWLDLFAYLQRKFHY